MRFLVLVLFSIFSTELSASELQVVDQKLSFESDNEYSGETIFLTEDGRSISLKLFYPDRQKPDIREIETGTIFVLRLNSANGLNYLIDAKGNQRLVLSNSLDLSEQLECPDHSMVGLGRCARFTANILTTRQNTLLSLISKYEPEHELAAIRQAMKSHEEYSEKILTQLFKRHFVEGVGFPGMVKLENGEYRVRLLSQRTQQLADILLEIGNGIVVNAEGSNPLTSNMAPEQMAPNYNFTSASWQDGNYFRIHDFEGDDPNLDEQALIGEEQWFHGGLASGPFLECKAGLVTLPKPVNKDMNLANWGLDGGSNNGVGHIVEFQCPANLRFLPQVLIISKGDAYLRVGRVVFHLKRTVIF